MQSLPLQVRALSRLSAIAYGELHDNEARRAAEQAIRLAEENGIDYWATDARIRLGNSLITSNRTEAEANFRRALDDSDRYGWLRLRALANVSLASLFDGQQHSAEYASVALSYYRPRGFAIEALQCTTLLARARIAAGLYRDAFAASREESVLAKQYGSPVDRMQAEEGMGQAAMGLEDYPQALAHFQAALFEAKTSKLDNYILWPIVESAEALWSSGHLDAAAEQLDSVPASQWAQASATSRVALDRAHIQLARGQFRQSLATIEQTLAKDPSGGGAKTDLLILKVAFPARWREPPRPHPGR